MLKGAGYRTGAFVGAFVLSARFGLNRDFDVYDDRYGHSGDRAHQALDDGNFDGGHPRDRDEKECDRKGEMANPLLSAGGPDI